MLSRQQSVTTRRITQILRRYLGRYQSILLGTFHEHLSGALMQKGALSKFWPSLGAPVRGKLNKITTNFPCEKNFQGVDPWFSRKKGAPQNVHAIFVCLFLVSGPQQVYVPKPLQQTVGLLSPKLYMDVPAGLRKSDFLFTNNFCSISNPSVYHFQMKSTKFWPNWVLFTIICPKYTQFE